MTNTLNRLFIFAYCALALGLALFTLTFCYAIEWRGPFRDLWEFIGLIQDQLNGQWDLNALLEPYGGIHRIFLPRLLFYLDYRFFAGSNFFALTVTIALHLAACYLFLRFIQQHTELKQQDKLLLLATVLLFFFSTTQIYNLIYISDNQVVMGNSFSVYAAALFCHYQQKRQLRYLYLANAMLLLACLSHSSSLMIAPAMIAVMIVSRSSRPVIIVQTLATLLLLAIYISGHDPLASADTNQISLWQRSVNTFYSTLVNSMGIMRYVGLHLGSPSSREWPALGIIIGYASIVYLFYASYRTYKQQGCKTMLEIFCLTLAWYGFFIALVTAYGRQIYPNSALTDRYQTLVMTYWAALAILFYLNIKKRKPAQTLAMPILALFLLVPHQYQNAEEMAWLSSRVNIAHTAATVGITDIDTVAATLSHPLLMDKKNLVAAYSDYFREHGLGYFSKDAARYFRGKNQPPVFTDAINSNITCTGKLISITTIDSSNADESLKFIGQGYASSEGKVENLLVLDSNQKVIGLGYRHRQKGELFSFLHPSDQQQWVGFIHAPQAIAYPLSFLAKTTRGYCQPGTESKPEK